MQHVFYLLSISLFCSKLNDLKKQLKIYKDENERQRRKTVALEESIQCSAEDAQKQITDLVQKLADFERLIGNLNEQRIITKAEDVKKLVSRKQNAIIFVTRRGIYAVFIYFQLAWAEKRNRSALRRTVILEKRTRQVATFKRKAWTELGQRKPVHA